MGERDFWGFRGGGRSVHFFSRVFRVWTGCSGLPVVFCLHLFFPILDEVLLVLIIV